LHGVQLRWIDTPTNQRLWGLGFNLRGRNNIPRFLPEVHGDVWQRAGRRPGVRLELGGRVPMSLARRAFDASLQVGYKSEGYLADAPMKAGVLASLGVALKF